MSEDYNDLQPAMRLAADAEVAAFEENGPSTDSETPGVSHDTEINPHAEKPKLSRPLKRCRLIITSPVIYQAPKKETEPGDDLYESVSGVLHSVPVIQQQYEMAGESLPEMAFEEGEPADDTTAMDTQPAGTKEALSFDSSTSSPQNEAESPVRPVQTSVPTERAKVRFPSHIPYMNIAPPYQSASVREDAEIGRDSSQLSYDSQTAGINYAQSFTPPEVYDDDDFGEMDSMRFAPIIAQPMPTPAPVPTFPAPQEEKRHSGFILFLLTLTFLISLAMVYLTGVADTVLSQVGIPSWRELVLGKESVEAGIPEVFSPETPAPEGNASLKDWLGGPTESAVAASKVAGTTKLRSMDVTPSSAKAPATLIFTMYSDETVTNIKLAKDDGEILFAEGRGAPSGDGILWQFTVEFEEHYEGPIHAYLRDGKSNWASSGNSVQVNVQ